MVEIAYDSDSLTLVILINGGRVPGDIDAIIAVMTRLANDALAKPTKRPTFMLAIDSEEQPTRHERHRIATAQARIPKLHVALVTSSLITRTVSNIIAMLQPGRGMERSFHPDIESAIAWFDLPTSLTVRTLLEQLRPRDVLAPARVDANQHP